MGNLHQHLMFSRSRHRDCFFAQLATLGDESCSGGRSHYRYFWVLLLSKAGFHLMQIAGLSQKLQLLYTPTTARSSYLCLSDKSSAASGTVRFEINSDVINSWKLPPKAGLSWTKGFGKNAGAPGISICDQTALLSVVNMPSFLVPSVEPGTRSLSNCY